MKHPLQQLYSDQKDQELVHAALGGNRKSLEELLQRHQHYIYNIALKMLLSPQDAEDVTQEILIKVITKLGQFEGRSAFRTWLYRITCNHLLKLKERPLERYIASFETYGHQLDKIKDRQLLPDEKMVQKELIEEAKLSCLSGMLLCLDRTQRLVYILGEIFGADHTIGANLLEISKPNFRKKLERARRDLYQFMQAKCGLVNPNNPCRCIKKTRGFIRAGWVDPKAFKYNISYLESIETTLGQKASSLDELIEVDYADLFRAAPFQEKAHEKQLFEKLFNDKRLKSILNLG